MFLTFSTASIEIQICAMATGDAEKAITESAALRKGCGMESYATW